ncbi:rho-related GTP-binding protein RhoA-A [Nematostella vectensis]|uniref:rho-related GTP-binding protein RhoA-A n=1 Tax=Nematostella vectensis TaxID=45351 RepID=UPI00207796BE|nr:rho-related GTP-binding protein RhoA-A [Nematostella vectensis]
MASERKLKVVLTGDNNVGKTTFLINLTQNELEGTPTAFANYELGLEVGSQKFLLDLWDTEGTTEYDRLRPLTYQGSDIILLCFDISNRQTFERIESKWLPETTQVLPGSIRVLIGNKNDIRKTRQDKDREIQDAKKDSIVTAKEAKLLAKKYDLPYMETSALSRHAIQEALYACVKKYSAASSRSKRDLLRRRSKTAERLETTETQSRDEDMSCTVSVEEMSKSQNSSSCVVM